MFSGIKGNEMVMYREMSDACTEYLTDIVQIIHVIHGNDDVITKCKKIANLYFKLGSNGFTLMGRCMSLLWNGTEDKKLLTDRQIESGKKKNKSQHIVHIDSLSMEIIARIYSFLPIDDQINAQKVCKKWHNYFTSTHFILEARTQYAWKSNKAAACLFNKIYPAIDSKFQFGLRLSRIQNIVGAAGSIIVIGLTLRKWYLSRHQKITEWTNMPLAQKMDIFEIYNKQVLENREFYKEIFDSESAVQIPQTLTFGQYNNEVHSRFSVAYLTLSIGSILGQIYFLVNGVNRHANSEDNETRNMNDYIRQRYTYRSRLTEDPILAQFRCQLSHRLPLIPVIDKCGHKFDYLAICDHVNKTVQCPIRRQRLTPTDIYFDLLAFRQIQARLEELKNARSPLVDKVIIYKFGGNLL